MEIILIPNGKKKNTEPFTRRAFMPAAFSSAVGELSKPAEQWRTTWKRVEKWRKNKKENSF